MTLPSANRTSVRILVVNHNSGPWLARCLASLQAQTHAAFEAVIVDNASTDESSRTTLPDSRFQRLSLEHNIGFAAGNNLAARGATTPWLALLNPDAMAAPDWLEQLLAEAGRHPEVAIFGSTQLSALDPFRLDGSGDCLSLYGMTWRSGHARAIPAELAQGQVLAVCGAAMMIRRDCFADLHGFEESLYCYVEDVDLCWRARLQGARVWQSAHARVRHVGGASSGSGRSVFALYHGNRNLIWVIVRCMPLPWLLLALPGSLLWTLLRAAFRGPLRQRLALLRALRDALLGLPAVWRARRDIQARRSVGALEVLGWLSINPLDALHRRCVLIDEA